MTRRFRLLSLCVFVCLVAGTLAFAQAPPLADVLTYSPTPNQNYGTYTSLFVQKGGGAISASYIKFNIATLPPGATVTKATLRLFVNQVTAPGNFDAYQLNTSWTEGGLTYSNAPALGTSATGNHPVSFSNASVNQFILLDVTSLVEAWANGSLPNNGLALAMTTSSGAVALDSKESIYTSHQPELEIVLGGTQGPPGPPGPQGQQGPVGPIGPQGPQGQQGSAGSNGQGFTFRAAFNSGTSYNPYDVVTYNGSTYDATVAIPPGGGTPDQNPHWTLMAQEGAQGQQGQQGAQGQQGPQGQQGATGPQGPIGPIGPQGPQGDQGQAGSNGTNGQGFTFRAAFDSGTNYNPYDVVTYNGSTYDASVAIPSGGGTPDQNPNWTLMAQEGAQGQQGQQGSQGQQGPQGQTGATGPQGPQGPQGEPGNLNPGSPYYIQNGTSQQASSNFNISGTGTAATFNASTGTFQIGGTTVLNAGGNNDTFVGAAAGSSLSTGANNTLVGSQSGAAVTGNSNSFFGFESGAADTTGHDNTYLGILAGVNATSGNYNTFVGESAGFSTTTGSSNIYLTNLGSPTENNTIRIGTQGTDDGEQNAAYIAGISGSTVSSGLPVYVDSTGKLGTAGGTTSDVTSFNTRTGAVVPAANDYSFSLLSGTLDSSQLSGTYGTAVTLSNASNSFTGNGAGLSNVPVISGSTFYIQNGTSQQASANFNISGSGTVGGTLNATTVNAPTISSYMIETETLGTATLTTGTLTATSVNAPTITSGTIETAILNTTTLGTGSLTTGSLSTGTLSTETLATGSISGVYGNNISGGINVFINSNGILGTSTSSRRFKDNILDMGEASSKLFQLRPVTFFYKPQYDDGSHILQYGLIAEEVAKVYPDLVVYGEDGQPQTIRYHLLTPMLLNELQKQNKVVTAQQEVIQTQQQRIDNLEKQNTDFQQRLSRLESLLGK